jgi:vacuolar-type H+-ATPase subunit C/Vma6
MFILIPLRLNHPVKFFEELNNYVVYDRNDRQVFRQNTRCAGNYENIRLLRNSNNTRQENHTFEF